MNNIFNLNRFWLLFKKHTIEHAKTYLMSAAVLAGILFLIIGFFTFTNGGRLEVKLQAVVFLFMIVAIGSIFTSMIFGELGEKKKAIPALTLPASHFEKYLVGWLYSFVIFQLVFVGVFYFIDGLIISLATPPDDYKNQLYNLFDSSNRNVVPGYIAFLYYGILHAFAFWGAVFFEKLHFIKTAFIFFLCLIFFTLLNKPLLRVIGGEHIIQNMPFSQAIFTEGVHQWGVLPDNAIVNSGIYILYLIIAFLWASTFFKLKEKQV
jgi:hypothetical protein